MRHGFKVHKLELARGLRGRSRLPVATCMTQKEAEAAKLAHDIAEAGGAPLPASLAVGDYLDLLVEALRKLESSETALTDVPRLIAVADGADEFVPDHQPGTPRMRVTQLAVDGRRVSVEVEYGHLGYAHRALAERREDDTDLDDKSPAQYFRIEFLVPAEGVLGLIVAETIARASALPALISWVNHTMRDRHGDDAMVRLMAHQLTDTARVDELLARDAVAEIHLVRHGTTVDGVPDDGKITVIEKVRTTSKMRNARDLIRIWVQRQRAQDPLSEDQQRREIRALAGVVDPAIAQLEFDDGLVKLDPGSGKMVEVRPTRVGELFIYEISDHRPDDYTWTTRARDKLLELAAAEGVSVVWG